MDEQTVPKYATLLYEVRKQLDISIAEYFYLDMVYHLSHDGWCYKSYDNIAEDMGISRIGVMKMRDRLTDRGLLIHRGGNKVKTSVIYNKVIQVDKKTYNKVTPRITKLYPNSKQSYMKNNNESNKEKREPKKLLEKGYTTSIADYEAKLKQSARRAQEATA